MKVKEQRPMTTVWAASAAEPGKDMKAPETTVEMDIARNGQELQPAHDRAREANAGHTEPRHAEAAVDEEIVGERGHADGEQGDDRHHTRPVGRRHKVAERREGEEGWNARKAPEQHAPGHAHRGLVIADMRQKEDEGENA